MKKVIKRIRMANMPFDKFVDGQFVHATGYMIELEDGSIEIEYEGEEYEDADDCIFEEEEEEEEEEENHCIYIYDDEMTEA